MMLVDTHKYGSTWVDADMTIENLEDRGILTEAIRANLELFRESHAEFEFDDDYPNGSMYRIDDTEVPLIRLGWFGGYPGESLDVANVRAAKEWAEGKSHIYIFGTWFGGCESVGMYIDISVASLEEAEEALELAENFTDYPVLDEDLWSEIQSERWDEMIREMITDSEQSLNTEFTENQQQYIYEKTQEFYGYWEEGYFPEEEWNEILEGVVDPEKVQQHQETKLW